MSDEVSARIVALTNNERARVGLSPLTSNGKLTTAAANYAGVMRRVDRLGHNEGGTSPGDRIRAVGYRFRGWSENVARNRAADAERAMRQWMGSAGHRAAILHPNRADIGVGVAGPSGTGQYYYCQLFGLLLARDESTLAEGVEVASSMSFDGPDES